MADSGDGTSGENCDTGDSGLKGLTQSDKVTKMSVTIPIGEWTMMKEQNERILKALSKPNSLNKSPKAKKRKRHDSAEEEENELLGYNDEEGEYDEQYYEED